MAEVSLFKKIRQSLKTENHDFTTGPISEAVILLAVPMILELSLESVFAVVDMFFVSRLGPSAIATVGLTESVVTLIYSLAIGVSTAATAIVARRVGEKNYEGASLAAAQSIIIGILLSIIISIFGVIYAGDILKFMGASEDVVTTGSSFTKIMLGGNLVIILLFLINGIFRGAGNAAIAMKSLWVASATNIVLCPILIHFMGLSGAAVATVIGRSAGVIYQLYYLYTGRGLLKFNLPQFRFQPALLKNIFTVAWPASAQYLIGSGSWILITRLVAETGGTEASAGYQIAFRNFVFFILPAWGLSNAAATLVGQNLGAKKIERATESVYTTAKYNAIFMAFVTLLFVCFSDSIVSVFTNDPVVREHAQTALQIIGSGYIFYGIAMVFSQSLNGAGDTKTPTWINFVCFWVFQTPLAYFLTKQMEMGPKGAVIAIPVAHLLFTIIAWWVFKKGRWKSISV